eukprot:m.58128 g.58128  ORF g.58128 m.58128 type:complete len:52 (+) comp11655_c0_seq3:999-1154(+)
MTGAYLVPRKKTPRIIPWIKTACVACQSNRCLEKRSSCQQASKEQMKRTNA